MKIMGILNVTPDSFSDGGNFVDVEKGVAHAVQMVADGADIIDIGGESTRPGAKKVTIEEELSRVIPVIKGLRSKMEIPISIDTYKAEVARQAVIAGATMINDIGGAKLDSEMATVMADTGVDVVLMHYNEHGLEDEKIDIISTVKQGLQESIDFLLEAGVKPEKIILDPGIGFGKTYEQNVELIKNINQIKTLGYPVLLGSSKKRVIGGLSGSGAKENLAIGTVATTCWAVNKGIEYVRVHDVKGNKLALNVLEKLL